VWDPRNIFFSRTLVGIVYNTFTLIYIIFWFFESFSQITPAADKKKIIKLFEVENKGA
jgi:ABC-type amino acid transport system permease subunit